MSTFRPLCFIVVCAKKVGGGSTAICGSEKKSRPQKEVCRNEFTSGKKEVEDLQPVESLFECRVTCVLMMRVIYITTRGPLGGQGRSQVDHQRRRAGPGEGHDDDRAEG